MQVISKTICGRFTYWLDVDGNWNGLINNAAWFSSVRAEDMVAKLSKSDTKNIYTAGKPLKNGKQI